MLSKESREMPRNKRRRRRPLEQPSATPHYVTYTGTGFIPRVVKVSLGDPITFTQYTTGMLVGIRFETPGFVTNPDGTSLQLDTIEVPEGSTGCSVKVAGPSGTCRFWPVDRLDTDRDPIGDPVQGTIYING